MIEYKHGSELPDVEITWNDSDGALRDFSSGWTFTVRVGTAGSAALIEKTTGITGAATDPNITISWDSGELDVLTAGTYTVDVIARFTATSQDLVRSFQIQKSDAILPIV